MSKLICKSTHNFGIAPPEQSYVTYIWKSDNIVHTDDIIYPGYAHVTLLESRTTIESGTTGLRTWPASLALAHYVIAHPGIVFPLQAKSKFSSRLLDTVHSRRVLELGCGAGFLGLIIATVQDGSHTSRDSAVWLTDVNDFVLQLCQNNLKLSCSMHLDHSPQ